MLLETIRVCRDALQHGTYGVNAQIAQLPIDPDDSRPPLIVNVLDPTRDEGPANGTVGVDLPCLLLAVSEPVDMDGEVTTNIRDVLGGIGVRIGTGLVMDQARLRSAQGWRDMMYTLRAVQRCYRQLLANANADARLRNNIQVRNCTRMTVVANLVQLQQPELIISGAVFMDLNVRDLEP